jgi:hypothetical protein
MEPDVVTGSNAAGLKIVREAVCSLVQLCIGVVDVARG